MSSNIEGISKTPNKTKAQLILNAIKVTNNSTDYKNKDMKLPHLLSEDL